MTSPRDHDGDLIYPNYKLRSTSAGPAVTVPVDALRSLGWRTGDSMIWILLDDGLVLCRKENGDADFRPAG